MRNSNAFNPTTLKSLTEVEGNTSNNWWNCFGHHRYISELMETAYSVLLTFQIIIDYNGQHFFPLTQCKHERAHAGSGNVKDVVQRECKILFVKSVCLF